MLLLFGKKKKASSTCLVLEKLENSAKIVGLSLEKLRLYSKIIMETWLTENLPYVSIKFMQSLPEDLRRKNIICPHSIREMLQLHADQQHNLGLQMLKMDTKYSERENKINKSNEEIKALLHNVIKNQELILKKDPPISIYNSNNTPNIKIASKPVLFPVFEKKKKKKKLKL